MHTVPHTGTSKHTHAHALTHIHTLMHTRTGAVHKVRHARGEGVREGVTVCDRGEGVQEHVTSHFKNIFIHMKPTIESDV